MEPADHTLRVLTEIRDEVRGTNERVDQTNERVHQTNERLVHLEEALSRRKIGRAHV